MELEKKIKLNYNGQEGEFRTLNVEDVGQSYVRCLRDQRHFIDNNRDGVTVEKQWEYIKNILLSEKGTISGLFINGILIGTTGVQNIEKGCLSTVGVFVLEKEMRGKGYGKALIWAACKLTNACCDVDKFSGSMKKINISSYKAFASCGFKTVKEEGGSLHLHLHINDLIKPSLVFWYSIE